MNGISLSQHDKIKKGVSETLVLIGHFTLMVSFP